jgi:hypothetical protein
MNRRQFISSGVVAAGAIGLQGCSIGKGEAEYRDATQRIWRHWDTGNGNRKIPISELVRYATLAPSSHNTQCWRFHVAGRTVSILPDLERRCPVVDPDDHHLFVSLGCAAENLVQAAAAFGLHGRVEFKPGAGNSLEVGLAPARALRSPLFEAIPFRQSTRGDFDGKPLSSAELKLLELAGTGPVTRVILLTDRQAMEAVLEFVVEGNTIQMRDPAFVAELKNWIRFGDAEAVRFGDGLSAKASGNPSVPRWLGSLLFGFFFTEEAENDKYARHVRSSAGVAVFVAGEDDPAHWIESGRAFERFALQATTLGVRTAHLNQPVEVAAVRPQFSDFLGLQSGRADLVVRFGRGQEMPRSMRRPLQAVLV